MTDNAKAILERLDHQINDILYDLVAENEDLEEQIEKNKDWKFYYDHGYAQAKRDLSENKGEYRPKGHWIKHDGYWECSECHAERAYGNEYCPNCGSHNGDIAEPYKKGGEWMSDLISRQAVIEAITKTSGIRGDTLKALYDLPSVENKGEWISHYDEGIKEGWYECSCCHSERAFNTNFCPDCGARMKGGSE